MKTRRRQVRTDRGYRCEVALEFEDLDPGLDLDQPATGRLLITLGDEVPHPAVVGIEDIEGEGDGPYVEFESRTRTVEDTASYPVEFRFTTNPAEMGGGKWYVYRTAEYVPDADVDPYDDPHIVKHHVGIPSAQKIRILHRILAGRAGEETVRTLQAIYDTGAGTPAMQFSEDVGKYAGFEAKVVVQDFLMDATDFHRSPAHTANKVAKQLVDDRYEHRVSSLDDVSRMVDAVDRAENFPEITLRDVFRKVVERSDKAELDGIADRLDIQDWSVVLAE